MAGGVNRRFKHNQKRTAPRGFGCARARAHHHSATAHGCWLHGWFVARWHAPQPTPHSPHKRSSAHGPTRSTAYELPPERQLLNSPPDSSRKGPLGDVTLSNQSDTQSVFDQKRSKNSCALGVAAPACCREARPPPHVQGTSRRRQAGGHHLSTMAVCPAPAL